MPSVFSNEIAGTFTPVPPAPVLLKVTGDGQPAKVSVQLPGPVVALAAVQVFYKTTSMEGSTPEAEIAAGTPYVSLPLTPAQAGQIVEVDIPDLIQDGKTEYFFDGTCV